MKKTRIWYKDNVPDLKRGDKVVVFRRKINGYPRHLKDGTIYTIDKVIKDIIVLKSDTSLFSFYRSGISDIKIHKSYLINIEYIRDEIINILLEE